MLYLVQTAVFFEESSLKELKRLGRFKIVDRFLNNFIVEAKVNIGKKFRKGDRTFIHSVFGIDAVSKITGDYLGSISRAVLREVKRVGKRRVILLECYDINERTKYSAKELEIAVGRRLIKAGYRADLIAPEAFVYFILLNGKCYAGSSDYDAKSHVALNPIRHALKDKISRAELKISQSFGEFGISGSGIALDLGAAPGGWSRFLARHHYKVIAIDQAELNYPMLRSSGLKVELVGEPRQVESALRRNDIVHLRARSEAVMRRLHTKAADIIVDDMNMDCQSSINVARSYSKFLKRGGHLLLTIKCITRNVSRYIGEAHDLLEPEFRIIGIRVVPSNRQEMMLYAVKR